MDLCISNPLFRQTLNKLLYNKYKHILHILESDKTEKMLRILSKMLQYRKTLNHRKHEYIFFNNYWGGGGGGGTTWRHNIKDLLLHKIVH